MAFIDFGFFKRLTDTDIRQLVSSTQATYERDARKLYAVIAELGALPDDERLAEPFLESYTAIFGWLLSQERITLDASMTAAMMRSYTRMRRLDGFDSLTLPAEHFVLMRGVMLLIGLVGQLQAERHVPRHRARVAARRRACDRARPAGGRVLRRPLRLPHDGGDGMTTDTIGRARTPSLSGSRSPRRPCSTASTATACSSAG